MDKVALVNLDIERGREILHILDRAKFAVLVALWVYLPEYEDWRLVLSLRQFDSLDPREAYKRIYESLGSAGFTPDKTPPLMILPVTDPFIRELRRIFRKARSVEGMRLGGQMIGNRFIEDAYVYRIS
jgi:hypothetical protein